VHSKCAGFGQAASHGNKGEKINSPVKGVTIRLFQGAWKATSVTSAVKALRKGAYDYLRKPFEPEELFASVKNAINHKMLKIESDRITETLRENEERFRRLAENAKDMIYRMSLPDGGYEYVSPASIDLFGYSPEEFYATPLLIRRAIHPDWVGYFEEQWANLVSGNMPSVYEYQIRHTLGPIKWLHQRNVLILGDNGKPKAIEAIVSDITERKRMEEEREKIQAQNWQLQKADSLNRMAGAIAHHFNNQLMVVMGNLELLGEDWPLSEKHLEKLTLAMKATRKAGEVSGLMLTYLGHSTSRQAAPMDVGHVCSRSLPLIQAVLPKKILLKTDFPSPGPTINGNVNQIQQVLVNLLTNAYEAAGDGPGTIQLTVKTVSAAQIPATPRFPIGWEPRDNIYACLEVTDGGCGIAKRDIGKIFDPFFTRKFAGRGLGLSVVLGVVRAHCGTITVESEPGMGTAFRVFLPVPAVTLIRLPKKTDTLREMERDDTSPEVENEPPARKTA
jgi:PAS domain S-box-containing protein